MDLSIEPVDASDETAMAAWFAVEQAAHATDRPDDVAPQWPDHRLRLSAPWPGLDVDAWLARRDGAAVGVGVLELPTRYNVTTALVDITVHPVHRRGGIGRALLAVVADAARSAGRVRMTGQATSSLHADSPGTAFAAAVGAKEAHCVVQRRLDLLTADPAGWPTPPGDLPLVQWAGATPDAWLDDIARMESRMSTDAPHGDLTWTAEVHDAARIRARDALCRAREIVVLTTAAVGSDGRLAAYNELSTWPAVATQAHTWNTLVLPEHRGRGLGLRVKLANLDLLRRTRPTIHLISTWNSASNQHMIAINEALGFRATMAAHEYEQKL